MPLRLLSWVTLRYPWTQGMRSEPRKVCQSSHARVFAVLLRMPVGVTCQRLAGFRGGHFWPFRWAPSLTACQLTAGEALGAPRLPRNLADAGGKTAMVNVYVVLLTSNVLVNQ